ncbi:MAG: CHASE2 domain-containing protein [Chitinivibrionales bacterium]|nr:CHASE2 domain-containing protein [Chitinivibrionales bacterium]
MELWVKIGKSLLIGTIMGIVVVVFTNNIAPELIDRLEYQSYYMRYKWKYMDLAKNSKENTDSKRDYGIMIVDIDDRTQHKLGVYWNWNRSYHATTINTLNKHFPAAVLFDINFHDPEDGNSRLQVERLLDRAQQKMPQFEIPPQTRTTILNTIDYDKQFIEATRESGVVFHGVRMSSENDYPNVDLSQIRQRATLEWHNKLNTPSCITLSGANFDCTNHDKTIIDGIFPELAQAAQGIGHLNVIPNDDGVIREVDLLYSFGRNSSVYLPITMRIAATLFATPNEEIIVEPHRYIDIGKPFKIFKDSGGDIRFSFPNMSAAQVKRILSKSSEILHLQPRHSLQVSTLLTIGKDSSGQPFISSNFGQLAPEVVAGLQAHRNFAWASMSVGDSIELAQQTVLRRDSDVEWLLQSPYGETEWYLSKENLEMIDLLDFTDFQKIAPGQQKLVFYNFTVYNKDGLLESSLPIFQDLTLKRLCELTWENIENLRPGSRMDIGPTIRIPLTPDNRHIVTYFGNKQEPFTYYPYYDIMTDRVKGDLQGKIYIVGSSVPSLFDIVNVPVSNNYPGVEVHASLLNSFLTNTFITRLEQWHDFLILLIVGIITGVIAYLLKPLVSSVTAMLFIIIYFLVAMTVFVSDNLWIEIVRPILTILLTYSAVMAYRYITEEKDRKFLQSTFKAYLSPELIDIMYKNKQMPKLGGDEGIRTAFFTDIQGFSTFSEKLGSPTRLVELLNEYLSVMTDILLRHYGTLDKYEGDAIIAFFGAPMPMQDHAQQACATALDMQKSLGDLRKKWTHEGNKWPTIVHEMRMRIGVNTGAITTGNMGSAVRMNYTMMGDAVNLAARLESAAKQYGVYTVISNFTYEQIKTMFEVRLLDKIMVVGKSEPVNLYELIGHKSTVTPEIQKLITIYTEGLNYFYTQQWDKAIEALTESEALEPYKEIAPSHMTPSRKIIQYSTEFKKLPPGPAWDGVMKLTSK